MGIRFFLECQDYWRISGIEQDVYLYSTPTQYIADYNVAAGVDKQDNGSFNGNFSLTTNIKGAGSGSVSYALTDEKGNTILSEDKSCQRKEQ